MGQPDRGRHLIIMVWFRMDRAVTEQQWNGELEQSEIHSKVK